MALPLGDLYILWMKAWIAGNAASPNCLATDATLPGRSAPARRRAPFYTGNARNPVGSDTFLDSTGKAPAITILEHIRHCGKPQSSCSR